MKFDILILDDERIVCNSIKRIIENEERRVHTATQVAEAWNILENHPIDLILLDYKLVETDGLSILKQLREEYPDILVIMITAYGNIDIAVEAMKLGAYDFIQKKEEPEFIRFIVQRALDNLRLKKEVEALRKSTIESSQMAEIVCVSPAMQQLLQLAEEYAKSDTTVLITGETGTGKNLLAHFVHYKSPRFSYPFVCINCAAIPRELLESELFGYERGAFTGARQKGKMGLIERANGGTLFLDEIAEMPVELQSKLLHVLETGEFFRIGAVEPIRVNIRVIAATNTDLRERVENKQFRLDLYYRLNIATLHIPPLRERREDILPLAKQFIQELNRKLGKNVNRIAPDAERFLETADWPGNVRELKNLIERAMLLKKDSVLCLEDFFHPSGSPLRPTGEPLFTLHLAPQEGKNLLQESQKQLVQQALEIAGQNRTRAAQLLGIPRTSLNFYIQKFGIRSGKNQPA